MSDAPFGALLGILALVNGFIDREALAAAFGAWTAERRRPLAEILVERGAITPAHRQLLEQLAKTLMERHAGGVDASLSSMSERLDEVDRTLLMSIDATGLEELQASLDQLRASDISRAFDDLTELEDGAQTHGQSDATGEYSSNDPDCRYQRRARYRQGGLGQIHTALDREFQRIVLVKTVLPEYVQNEAMRTLFRLEAEVTGHLEHPGIVPAYGLGTFADGQPYYAMRLVKGQDLKERLDRFHGKAETGEFRRKSANLHKEGRELRELIRHFVTVCQTMEYAHKRGVIHRDLKPSNLMLGDHGETFVIDWGLAKAVNRRLPEEIASAASIFVPRSDRSDPDKAVLGPVGTPGYMPGEQYDAETGPTTPASDVYALGAILYEILTGRGPFERFRRADREAATQRGDFPPPRHANPTAPRPLEAICLKAMSLKPEQRYATAAALAADLKSWQDDEPILALKDRWPDRVGRWERKHRTAVRVGGAAAVLLALGATLAAAALGQAWANTSRERDRVTHERNRAMLGLGTALGLSDDLQQLTTQYLSRVPASVDWCGTISDKCTAALKKLQAPFEGNPTISRSVAIAHSLRASLVPLQREAVTTWESRMGDAIGDASDSVVQARVFFSQTGQDTERRLTLAQSLISRARLFVDLDQYGSAEHDAMEALDRLDTPAGAGAAAVEVARSRLQALLVLAKCAMVQGNVSLSIERVKEALEEQTRPGEPGEKQSLDQYPLALLRMELLLEHSQLLLLLPDRARAIASVDAAVALGRALNAGDPYDPGILLRLLMALTSRSAILGAELEWTPELEREVAVIYNTLADFRNGGRRALSFELPLIQTCNWRAMAALARGDQANARRYLSRAEDLRDDLRNARSPGADDLREEARTELLFARLAQSSQDRDDARSRRERARDACDRYRKALPAGSAPHPDVDAIRRELESLDVPA